MDEKSKRIAELEARIRELEQLVRDLTARLKLNSRNSSVPPSSDWTRKKTSAKGESSGRKRGGQPGHEGVTRQTFPPDQVDQVLEFFPKQCRHCHTPLKESGEIAESRQVAEVPASPAQVIEYRRYRCLCPRCEEETVADFSQEVPASCVGPRLQAVLTSLTGRYRLSRREACEAAEALFGPKATIALGTLSAMETRTSRALEAVYTESLQAIRGEPAVNVDETSWRQDKGRAWLWTASSPELSVFHVDPTRSAEGFHALMGSDYGGVLGSDRWSAYHGHKPSRRQLCWAHLKRNFQALTERGHKGASCIGRIGLEVEKAITQAWRKFQQGRIAHASLRVILHGERKRLEAALTKGSRSTDAKTAALSKDVLKRFTALWTFTRREGVEPTNNRAERALRKAVLWRKGSFGSDSAKGSRFVERMLTVAETLRSQGRSLVDFLERAIKAHARGHPHPSLLPVPL